MPEHFILNLPPITACSPPIIDTPTRLWSRFENKCVRCNTDVSISNNSGYIPIMCTDNPSNYDLDMRRKAEVLQYNKNNAKLTKKQKWAQMVNGHGPGGKKVWATQTINYTNPNIKNLDEKFKFSLLCVNTPVTCALPSQCDVPGNGPLICMEKNVPLTRYITRRTYKAGGTKWPEKKWKPGDNGFPRWKSGRTI